MMRGRRNTSFGKDGYATRVPTALANACCQDVIREEELRRQGWTRRFMSSPPRLQEAEELYEALGLEVRLERPGPEDLAAQCESCPAAVTLFRVIYTRPRK